MGNASAMRNLTSPNKLVEWARADGVPQGAIRVIPVWEGHFVLVVPTCDVRHADMDKVVSRRR